MSEELCARVLRGLELLYGTGAASALVPRIEALVETRRGKIAPGVRGWSQKDALLITYGDSLLGAEAPLAVLQTFLSRHVGRRFSFVHLLPFYPSTSDDGFAVVDYRAVRPDLGQLADVSALGEEYRLVFDAVINHVSASSRYVQGFLGGDPAFSDFCIDLPPEADTSAVARPRTLPLRHVFPSSRGPRWLWTTFSRDQVDLNFANPEVLIEILDVLLFYAAQGASVLRLDAIPYLWKEPGTTCVHLPETHAVVKLVRDVFDAAAPHVLLLTETNVPHPENISYFGAAGDEAQMIYNFTLAPLILWALHRGDASALTEWARSIAWVSTCATYLNITATHDGIGLRPAEGILSGEDLAELAALARERGGAVSARRTGDGSESPYELNISYFDAINDPERPLPMEVEVRRFLVSQAIPMAMMGIPGIYIHSLLGSRNDIEGAAATGLPRRINRAQLPVAALEAELLEVGGRRRLVMEGILRLLEIRAGETAFHPDAGQEVLFLHPAVFALRRSNPQTGVRLLAIHSISAEPLRIALPSPAILPPLRDLLTGEVFDDPNGSLPLGPYAIRWLRE